MLSESTIPISDKLQRKINTKNIIKNVEVAGHIPKLIVPEIPAEIRKLALKKGLVGKTLKEQIIKKARRCLNCGTTCYDQSKKTA